MIRNFGKFTKQPIQVDQPTGFKFYPLHNEKGEDFHLDIVKPESKYEGSVFLEAVLPYYAAVESDGKIRVISDEPSRVPPDDGEWFIGSEEEIVEGDYYDPEANETYTPEVVVEPTTVVTMRQAKIALSRRDLLAEANDAIAALPGQQGEEARIEWEYATQLERSHPLVAALGQQLELTEDDIDTLFIEASQI
ncbi:hypothetical protein NDN16_05185 [Aureimonas altamirensis]|uniref:hypothetical protein n=1 Tax=Aureimonas altamirensis TaxID=370622 RepID=UPI0020374149|nr:hypothetical protein [Aureimonas altamirensis]MCM2503070.1 hypothetical protein [Aureimonas altamirensis]